MISVDGDGCSNFQCKLLHSVDTSSHSIVPEIWNYLSISYFKIKNKHHYPKPTFPRFLLISALHWAPLSHVPAAWRHGQDIFITEDCMISVWKRKVRKPKGHPSHWAVNLEFGIRSLTPISFKIISVAILWMKRLIYIKTCFRGYENIHTNIYMNSLE